ncbi:hypothetical protein IIB34_02330 [PVC group bacterium]|nr:hypothetical protein [PVC group bacterium]
MPWSTRIPAAIEKAEAGLRGEGMRWRYSGGGTPIEPMEPSWTAGEVVTIKALWDLWQDTEHFEEWAGSSEESLKVLIAFCEKVERLT